MNSAEINELLRRNVFTKKYFEKVYAANQLILRKRIKKNKKIMIIANTHPNSFKNGHWVAFFISPTTIEVFDSLGAFSLFTNEYFKNFIKKNARKKILYNALRLQSGTTDVCGEWVILYCFFRAQNKTFKNFLKQFNPGDNLKNDKKVLVLFAEHFLYPNLL